MKKALLLLFILILIVGAFGYLFFQIKNSGKGALQVTATPQSNVYLNGNLIGKTPVCKCDQDQMFPVGEYAIKVEPIEKGYRPFEEKIPIGKSVLTVVDRTFDKGSASEGSVITLSPLSDNNSIELYVLSFPDKANVFIDNNPSGATPLLVKDVKTGDHEIRLVKDSFREKIIRIHTASGYKLATTVYLGLLQTEPSASSSASPSASPSPKPGTTVLILQTPTGFLRVRSDPSLSGTEISQVKPGETYSFVMEQNGWFEIKLKDGTTGWVSGQYAQKQ